MAAPVKTTRSWTTLDSNVYARDWVQDSTGAHHEQDATADPMGSLAKRLNHCLGRQPQVTISKVWTASNAPTTELDPLCVWPDQDSFDNRWQYLVQATVQPRASNAYSGPPRFGRYAGCVAFEYVELANIVVGNVSNYGDCIEAIYHSYPSEPTHIETADGVSCWNGFSPYAFVAQGIEQEELYEGTRLLARPFLARKKDPIRADAVDDLRSVMDRARRTYLPHIGWWMGQGVTAEPTPPGDHRAIAISNAVRVNLFDVSQNARNAVTPGMIYYGYRLGVGREDQNYGKRFPIVVRAYARSLNADTNICVEGPAHMVPNKINIAVTGDNVVRMCNGAGVIWGNPLADENCANTERNKLDWFSEGVSGGGTVYIYGLYALCNDPMPYLDT